MDFYKKQKKVKSPEEAKSQFRKQVLAPTLINLAVSIGMVIIGVQYSDQDKTESAAIFLKVAGGVLLTSSIIKIFAYLVPSIPDEKVVDIISPILDLAYFIVVIWGSVKVFGMPF